ncbi:MAG: lysylphosphatidylglycerol synthase transmembrane domain-containing protein [Ekhidna sp.]
MSKGLVSALKLGFGIVLAAGLMYLVFRNVDWEGFLQKAKEVNYSWVIFSIFLSLGAYVVRAYRWNLLLQPLGYELKTERTTLAVLIGYVANLVLPRLGEVTRCGVLNRNDDVSITHSFGSVVTERIVDFLTLLFFIALSLVLEYERLMKFISSAYQNLHVPSWIWLAGLVIGLIFMSVAWWFFKNREKFKGKLMAIVRSFIDGLLSIRNLKHKWSFFISTIVIWIIYYLMSYVIIFSLPESSGLGLTAGLMLLVTGGIALSIPVQSGFGTYHGMIAGMLLLYGIEHNTGIFLATLLHTSQIIAVAFFGSIALFISFLIRRRKVAD